MDLFNAESTLENVNRRAEQLTNRLSTLTKHEIVGDIRQRGLIAGIELVADRDTKQPFDAQLSVGATICNHMMRYGVWMRPLRNVLVIMPPLCVSAEQLDEIVDAIDNAITEFCQH